MGVLLLGGDVGVELPGGVAPGFEKDSRCIISIVWIVDRQSLCELSRKDSVWPCIPRASTAAPAESGRTLGRDLHLHLSSLRSWMCSVEWALLGDTAFSYVASVRCGSWDRSSARLCGGVW